MEEIKDYSLSELRSFLKNSGQPRFCAEQIFGWIYRKGVEDFEKMTDISKEGRRFLKSIFYFFRPALLKKEKARDRTEKFLLRLKDGNTIETVLIPEGRRETLCLSTQVGCKFSCEFCLSAKDGFRRNLDVSEIIDQYLFVSRLIAPRRITNLVFMGIGEPLDNFSNTIKAINIFIEPKGLALGRRKICLSTCGLTPQIKKLGALNLGIKLSLSLHSAKSSVRSKIMPVNKKYPLEELIRVIKAVGRKGKTPITFEYALIAGINTKKDDVFALKKLVKGINYKINLIPFNRACGEFFPSGREEIVQFSKELKKQGLFFTFRKSRGQEINAACGQLRALRL